MTDTRGGAGVGWRDALNRAARGLHNVSHRRSFEDCDVFVCVDARTVLAAPPSSRQDGPGVARLVGDLDRAAAEAYADLRDAVELMDRKVTPYGVRDDGTTASYIVADSTWHRVLAIARGSTSEAARAAIDALRSEQETPR